MLPRYLDVEDDEVILSALCGGSIASNRGGECYEPMWDIRMAVLHTDHICTCLQFTGC